MRDDDDGLADALLDAAELPLELGTRDRIERAERFVHQQHGGIGGERPRDADPLPLAAGKLRGPALAVFGGEADQLEQLRDTRGDARRLPALEPRHHADVAGDGHVRKEADVLDDVADRPAQRDRIPLAGVAAADEHAPLLAAAPAG